MGTLPQKLNHIGAKIARSIEHFNALDGEITAFLNSKPYAIRREFDAEKRSYSFFVNPLAEVPLRIRILTGEMLGQLRSCLDHLAWQLALITTPTPHERTEFPIFAEPAQRQIQKIGSLPEPAQAIVEKLQPYHDQTPEKNTLWKLHRLANEDKHRLPHIALLAPAGVSLGNLPELPGGGIVLGFSDQARKGRDLALEMRIGPIEGEEKVGEITFIDPKETDLSIEGAVVPIDLAFAADSAGAGMLVRPELVSYGKRVEEIVREFTGFF